MNRISNHPTPQLERDDWVDLNGKWEFTFNKKAKKNYKFLSDEEIMALYHNAQTDMQINVPFCVESELSGIGYTDFINHVCYRKIVEITPSDKRIFLNIGAADYKTTLLVNGTIAGSHRGGYTPARFEITNLVIDGSNEIFILCEDNTRDGSISSGKQSEKKESYACSYTRTTGIWQSVYLEYTPKSYIEGFKIYPDVKNALVTVEFSLKGCEELNCRVLYNGKIVSHAELESAENNCFVQLKLDEVQLWEAGCGRLYDLEFTFGEDRVKSYFGLREVALDGYKFLLNSKSVFQRLVLDQGFYRKGIYTAQNDEELVEDIKLSMKLGFNGARLHQKVFDPRFLYFCDRMGYIVWGEYANWGLDYSDPKNVDVFLSEWSEAVNRDFNHPSIIGWCPFNETWDYHGKRQYDPLLSTAYDFTKQLDKTRPCIDTSGNFHVKTDIYDVHDYRYDAAEFKASYDRLVSENYLYEHVLNDNPNRQKYNGEAVFISEYGGIKWAADEKYKSWGYGEDVKTPEEFAERYCALTDAIMKNPKILGFCYTQLYDVEQEQNGLYTYDRRLKFSGEIYDRIKAVNEQQAEIEK